MIGAVQREGCSKMKRFPTLVFATICTRKRKPLLATPRVHRVLRWWFRHKNWIVSIYVVMPDHVHFFAEPHIFDDWITCWKRGIGRLLKHPDCRWQAGSFHHRIRCFEGSGGEPPNSHMELGRSAVALAASLCAILAHVLH